MVKTLKISGPLLAGAVLALLTGGVTPVGAQVSDHLKCYRIRDSITATRYTADVVGLQPQPGCIIRARAKLLCTQTTKTGVTPTPPGGGPSSPGAAGKFLCYRMKCPPNVQIPGQTLNDQFGLRVGTAVITQMICAPASPSGAFLDIVDSAF